MPTDDFEQELLEKHPEKIREMFAEIAPRYDLTNTILTGSTDDLWRRRAAQRLTKELRSRRMEGALSPDPVVVDACAGTGKLGREIKRLLDRGGTVYITDFCVPLLRRGIVDDVIDVPPPPVGSDLLRMPLKENTADAVSIGFGYRNVVDRKRALREIRRILKPGGLLLILEFHVPTPPIFRDLYQFYMDRVLPVLGRVISGSRTGAYQYLNKSVQEFPTIRELTDEFRREGFEIVHRSANMFGISHQYLLASRGASDDI